MASFLSKLADELRGAVTAGIITADQAQRLTKFSESRHPSTRSRGVIAFGVIAGLLIATGICLISAHNWERIPDLVKMGAFLAILVVAGEGARRARSLAVGAPLDVLWFALPLLGIGLWAQIFQLSGDPVKPYLVWTALTLPMAWASERRVARALHVAALFLVLFWGNFVGNNLMTILTWRFGEPVIPAAAWALTAAVVAAIAAESPGLPPPLFVASVGGVLYWVVMLTWTRTWFHVSDEPAEFLAGISAAVLWVTLTARLNVSDGARKLPRVAWFTCVYAMTFLTHARYLRDSQQNAPGVTLTLVLAAAAVAFTILIPVSTFGKSLGWRRFGQVLLLMPVLLAGVMCSGTLPAMHSAAVIANFVYFAAAAGLIAHGVKVGSPSEIDQGLLGLLILLVTRFVDVFGSLVRSGVAFIVLGLMMVGGAWVLHRGRSRLKQMSEENAST